MAAEYKLHLVYRQEFHNIYEEHQKDREFGQLLVRMKVVDSEGASAMNEDQWEAASRSLSVCDLWHYWLNICCDRHLYRIRI
jgi:hypothetical protein